MHAYELVQLAALVSVNGPAIVQSRQPFPELALDTYWAAAKCRQEHWSAVLKSLSAGSGMTIESATVAMGVEVLAVLDEILTSEVLSRIWAAVGSAADRARGADEAGPIVSSVLTGHLEARNRVLSWMVHGHGLGIEDAVGLNRRRVRNERWTDMLLSFLAPVSEVSGYSFDARRVADWTRALRADRSRGRATAQAALAHTTLAAAGSTGRASTPHGELNRRIAASVMACLPAGLFDSLGCPASARQLTLFHGVHDSQGQLNLDLGPARDAGDPDRWFRRRDG